MTSFHSRSRRASLLAACWGVLLLAPLAHAQLTYERTIQTGTTAFGGDCSPATEGLYHLADDQSGGILATGQSVFARYTSGWSRTFYKDEPLADYQQLWGAIQLSDGRIVTPDYGYGPLGQSFVVWDAAGRYVRRWPVSLGSVMTTPELGSNGDFYHAMYAGGSTTIRQFNATGGLTRLWSVATAGASRLAVRNGVIHLAGDAAGKIYRFDLSGTPLSTLDTPTGAHAKAIDVDGAGRIFVLTQSGAYQAPVVLWILAPDGTRLAALDHIQAGVAFDRPTDLLVHDDSRVYVSDPSYAPGAVHQFRLDAQVPALPATWGRVKALYR